MLVLALGLTMVSCDPKDPVDPVDPENPIGAIPSFTLSSASAMNKSGETVSTTLSITSPEGAKRVTVLKNGLPQDPINLNYQTQLDTTFTYVVEALDFGSTVTFTFQVVDSLDRHSTDIRTFIVTVIAKEIVEVPEGDVATTTWTNDKIWRLNGFVRVQEGQVLTIEPGTLIIGDRESKGTLIVQMGGKIIADGTAQNPIVMTSERAPGMREPGDWGGLVICGKARNNVTAKTGQPVELEGGYGGFHGGTDDNDNSGIIRYVRIEYAGIPINPNEEVNSLTMGSVGSGTIIEYVMCSYGLDDAYEWFGGSVNAKHLISFRNLDDDLDVDLGFSGRVQFALIVRGPSLADQSGSNAFEVDNNGSGNNDEPFTSGIFANVSVIGPKKNRETPISLQFQHAAQLRRNSRISIYNSFLTGFPEGLYIDTQRGGSGQAALDGYLQIRNVYLAGVENWGGNGYGSIGTVFVNDIVGYPKVDGVDDKTRGNQHPTNPRGRVLKADDTFPGGASAMVDWFNTASFNNKLVAKWNDLGIDGSIFDLGKPKLTLNAGSTLSNAAKWDNTPKADNFFQKVTHIGAFGNVDWTEGWAEWDAHQVRYF